jgi:hypothetical protein
LHIIDNAINAWLVAINPTANKICWANLKMVSLV